MSKQKWKEWFADWVEPWRFYASLNEMLISESLGIEQIPEMQLALFERMEELGLPLVEEKNEI